MTRFGAILPRRDAAFSSVSSSGSKSVTTAAAPQSRIASRSRLRSRCHPPVIACGSYFPGQKVIPIRPTSDPGVTTAICRGWDIDVLIEIYSSGHASVSFCKALSVGLLPPKNHFVPIMPEFNFAHAAFVRSTALIAAKIDDADDSQKILSQPLLALAVNQRAIETAFALRERRDRIRALIHRFRTK